MTVSVHNTALHSNCQPRPRSLMCNLAHMITVAHQRRQLLALDDHLLNDIGVTRAQALEEARQSVWDAPDHWRK